jgi:hypothetical protein
MGKRVKKMCENEGIHRRGKAGDLVAFVGRQCFEKAGDKTDADLRVQQVCVKTRVIDIMKN